MDGPRPAAGARAPAGRSVTLSRDQRDRIAGAARALERQAEHSDDALAVRALAADLERVVGAWDRAADATPTASQRRLREALRQIAEAESGLWGWIARDALADAAAAATTDGDAAGLDGHSPEIADAAIAVASRPLGARAPQ